MRAERKAPRDTWGSVDPEPAECEPVDLGAVRGPLRAEIAIAGLTPWEAVAHVLAARAATRDQRLGFTDQRGLHSVPGFKRAMSARARRRAEAAAWLAARRENKT